MTDEIKVRTVPALLSPFASFAREFGDKITAIALNPIMVTPKAAVIVDTVVIPKG